MTKKLSVLDRVDIPSPCSADWDKMKGNDVVRFCDHCNFSVHDLSAMTRTKANKLVLKSKGRLCVRYTKTDKGAIQHATQKVYQISRRASRIAAGVFSAALSLSSIAYAQSQTTIPNEIQTVVATKTLNKINDEGQVPSLSGKVTDLNGAIVVSVTIIAVNQETGKEYTAISNEEGVYVFYDLEEGNYKITIQSMGFSPKEETLQIPSGAIIEKNLQFEQIEIVTLGGEIAISYQSSLLNAVHSGNVDAVKEQIANGADVNSVAEGTSVLHLAVSTNNVEIVRLLLSAGANPNITDEEKQTPLMMLYSDANMEIFNLLLHSGAKVNSKDSEGQTVLMNVAENGNVEMLKSLLRAGAKINRSDNEGKTALIYAVQSGDIEKVKVLLSSGAEIGLKDKEGKTALNYAVENGNEEVIELLKDYGAGKK